jgi:hypothetical protein
MEDLVEAVRRSSFLTVLNIRAILAVLVFIIECWQP